MYHLWNVCNLFIHAKFKVSKVLQTFQNVLDLIGEIAEGLILRQSFLGVCGAQNN